MDNQTIQQITGEICTLITILSPLALALFGAYKAQLHKYVQAKIDTIKDDNLRKVATDTLDRVDKIATNVITNIDVNMKPTIIEDIKKGTMTRDDLNKLKLIAKDDILNQMTKDSRIALGDTVGDMNSYIETLIESKLAQLKIDSTSPVSKTEINMPTQKELDAIDLQNKLSQVQSKKDELLKQVDSIGNDKANVEQNNNQLVQQNQQLTNQVQDLQNQITQVMNDKQIVQSKLDSITATLNQVVQPANIQASADVNGITTNTVQ